MQLAETLSTYVCKLLNNVRGRDELEIVLNKCGKETEEKYERLARLDLAIKYEEKPVNELINLKNSIVIWLIIHFKVCSSFELSAKVRRNLA